jgi:hypothetical protein
MRLTTVGNGKACCAFTHQESREVIFSSALLFVGLAILAPPAKAQQCGYAPANLTSDAIYGNCDLGEFSHGNISGGTPDSVCHGADSNACPPNGSVIACDKDKNTDCESESPATPGNKPGEGLRKQTSDEKSRNSKPADFNRDIYYKNKLEFSLDFGWLPINIPFPFDVFEGDPYKLYPLRYTLVPVIASLRWHMTDIGGPWILRGNWDLTCSGSYTAIPRGPETRYISYIMGIRRNFVPRNWRVAPYWDIRLGLGDIDAKGPSGVKYAQGQDFTFTANMGSGVRYNFNPRYAISAGLNYMHISNAGLSGKSTNYGINVYGPMVGLYINLRKRQPQSEQ